MHDGHLLPDLTQDAERGKEPVGVPTAECELPSRSGPKREQGSGEKDTCAFSWKLPCLPFDSMSCNLRCLSLPEDEGLRSAAPTDPADKCGWEEKTEGTEGTLCTQESAEAEQLACCFLS
eukprot:1157349-Pelagomonas_calceolata.AAC.11